MTTQIQEYISLHKLFTRKCKVLVGLSGGPDSMALIHVLTQLGYNCIAVHCNFHLREEASIEDEEFVKKWCCENDIPLYVVSFDTYLYAMQHKISIEMAARDLRYNMFEEIRVEQKAQAIAVGHHKDDSVETILINLIRGTGIKGLTGISTKNKHIVRPLLAVSRSEIMDYLSVNDVPYVIDQTNEEELFTRNIIRLNVLPTLEKINPSVKNSIIATSKNLIEAEKIYDGYILNAIETVFNDNLINVEKLAQTFSPQSVLFELLSPMGFTPSVIADIANNLDSISGKIYLSDHYRLLKDRKYLVISEYISDEAEKEDDEIYIYADSTKIDSPFNLTIVTEEYTALFNIQKSNSVLHADIDQLSFPLILRKWRKGDWFVPFGMKGKKKISDFFTDNKFTLFQKEETWVLVSGDDIVWIVNYRADNRFRITDNTKSVYSIRLIK